MDLNSTTGQGISGWPHVLQSLGTLLSTRLNTRVFRREFGSEMRAFIDAPSGEAEVLGLYVAVAEAIWRWEPRFDLTNVSVSAEPGVLQMTLAGHYRPNGHLGDLVTVSDEETSVTFVNEGVESWKLVA